MNQLQAVLEVQNDERLMDLSLDLVNKHGLAWSPIKEQLFTKDGTPTNSYGIFRSDDRTFLSSMSKYYQPLDNFELAQLLVFSAKEIQDLSVEESSGGLLSQGRKVYIQIPLPQAEIGNASVVRQLTAINSHDGSSGVAFGTTQTVIACSNTFYKAYRHKDMTRVGHHSTMRERLNETIANLHKTISEDLKTIEKFRKMLDITPQKQDIEALKDRIFNVDDIATISTRKSNSLAKFDSCVEIEFAKEGTNLWGLFNAVTRYTNHEMKSNLNSKEKLANVLVGTGRKMNETAYNHLMHYVVN